MKKAAERPEIVQGCRVFWFVSEEGEGQFITVVGVERRRVAALTAAARPNPGEGLMLLAGRRDLCETTGPGYFHSAHRRRVSYKARVSSQCRT